MENFNKTNLTIAKKLRKDLMPWERKLWYCFLKNYNVKFRKQYTIKNYIVDFYCSQAKLAIELDGSQHFENESLQSDKERDLNLEKLGIKVLRIANNDIDKNFKNVIELIDNEVKNGIIE